MKREILTSNHGSPFIGVSVERKSYDEIIDFFARGPSPAEVLDFRPSKETTERVRYLLNRNAASPRLIVSLTSVGRATERLLRFNLPHRIALRRLVQSI